jgi:hypothetical protein
MATRVAEFFGGEGKEEQNTPGDNAPLEKSETKGDLDKTKTQLIGESHPGDLDKSKTESLVGASEEAAPVVSDTPAPA